MKNSNIFAIIVLMIVLIIGIVIILNISNSDDSINGDLTNIVSDNSDNSNIITDDYKEDEYPISINNSLDIPSPSEILFHHNGTEYIFEYGSDAYKRIIELNTLRDSEISYTKCSFHTIDDIKDKIDLLEYRYKEHGSIYFNLTGIYEYIGFDGSTQFNGSPEEKIEVFWIYNLYNGDTFTGSYGYGLKSPNELVEYLNSII